jgi:branched-chain amino acid transport system permease protein
MTGTLFGQSIISGLLTGSLYGLLAIGLSLSWGLLRIVNISHFALAFLAAYLTYQLGTAFHLAVWWSAMLVVSPRWGRCSLRSASRFLSSR